jgi:hypothetical protein
MPLPDVDSFATLAGPLNQYSSVEDPTTDLPAVADNALRGDAAAMTHSATRGYWVFLYNGSTVTITEADAVWGSSPTYYPTPARTSAGLFTLTFPTTVPYVDSSGTANVNLRRGWANIEGSPLEAHVERTSANVVTVRVYTPSTLAATDPTNFNVVVFMV